MLKVQAESVPQSTTPRRAGVPCCRASSLSSAGGGARKVPPAGGVWEPGTPTPWPSGPTSVCIRVLRLACNTCMCLLCACVHSVSVYVYMCHVQMCAWVCVHGCSACVCVSVCVCICMCICVCMCVCMYANACLCRHKYLCVCLCAGGGNEEAQTATQQVSATDVQGCGDPSRGNHCLQGRRGWRGGLCPPCAHHLPNSAAPSPSALGFWAQIPAPRPRTWRASTAEAWQPGR